MEAVIMDYEGEPVIIEDGELLVVYPDDGEHWNSTTRQFEPDDEDDEPRLLAVVILGKEVTP